MACPIARASVSLPIEDPATAAIARSKAAFAPPSISAKAVAAQPASVAANSIPVTIRAVAIIPRQPTL
jgi:hypothetical protein